MALAYLANIMSFYFFSPINRGSLAGTASAIAVSMASRVLLNLRRSSAHAKQPHVLASTPQDVPVAHNTNTRTMAVLEDEDDDVDADGLKGARRHRKVSSITEHMSWTAPIGTAKPGLQDNPKNAGDVWEMQERC